MGTGTSSGNVTAGGENVTAGGGNVNAENDRSDSAPLSSRGALAEPQTDGTNHPRRRGGRQWFWNLALGAVIIAGSLVGIVLLFGRVSGREFAPSHFQLRRFSFLEIPMLRVQVSPVRYTSMHPALARYLRTKGKITVHPSRAGQWHLVELRRGGGEPVPADAKLLVDFLEQRADRPPASANAVASGHATPGHSGAPTGLSQLEKWHQWSLDHPAMATALWPKVQQLALRELYVLIPDLFRIADEATSEPEMSAAIDALLVTRYEQMISDFDSAGQSGLAESLRKDALADYPDDPRWQPHGRF